MSAPPPPAAAGTPVRRTTGREGWLRRVYHRVTRFFLGLHLEGIEVELEAVAAGLQKETAALSELRRYTEERIEHAMADLRELRDAYLVTRGEFEVVRERLSGAAEALGRGFADLQREVESLRDQRLPTAERDLAALQHGVDAVQREVVAVRDGGVPRLEATLAGLQRDLVTVQGLSEELRDRRLPALSARTDALVERLHEELAATGGLVERLAVGEPLGVAVEPDTEAAIPEAVRAASVQFADAFRGERGEILNRAAEYLPLLAGASPVLDLGCGRGELLEALRDAGIVASGVDADPAMVEGCRRRGLDVAQGDAVARLGAVPSRSLGAITAVHVVEHLAAARWMELAASASRALRPGGLLLIESPNPESLRVGGSLFWLDPTHRAPIHPEALAFVVRAVGLRVEDVRRLHPFPPEQSLADPSLPAAVRELAARLDAWLSGARDFLLIARKAAG